MNEKEKVPYIKEFWCQKIIPLVYDDSLSFYEAICKMTQKVNELVDFINDVLEQKLNEYILALFNKLMINAIYDEPSETITLYLDKGVDK